MFYFPTMLERSFDLFGYLAGLLAFLIQVKANTFQEQ